MMLPTCLPEVHEEHAGRRFVADGPPVPNVMTAPVLSRGTMSE
ncbi:hypothetical protein [Streptomyces lunaelactis]|nr:hypothetical protein [Streptomyces lunaelactis]